MVEFWYQLPVTASVEYIYKCALKAEEVGFDGLTHEDHFIVKGVGAGCRPECWTFLSAIAMVTKLKVGSLVTCIPYRPPTLLAKIITTLDHLSKGRVVLIYGAGWWKEEFENFGYTWEPDKVRVDRTLEAIRLIKRLWTEENVTFEGKFYRVKNCTLYPRPYQKPHPPIICGGKGKRMRIFAAKNVDGWMGPFSIDAVDEYLESKETIDRYVKGRKFIYGLATRFKMDKVSQKDLKYWIEKYIEIGVDVIDIRMDPDTENLRLLDKIAPVIRYFKSEY